MLNFNIIVNSNLQFLIRRVVVILLLWLLIPCSLFAQYTAFTSYTLDHGLPSNTAYYIMKDVDGYIWITTDRGLVKYDGYDFKVYTTQDGLSDNEMFEAFQDSKKRIWFSTLNGIPTLYANNSFYSFEHLFNTSGLNLLGPCFRVLEIRNSIWFLTRKHLLKLNPNNIIEVFPANNLSFVSMAFNNIKDELVVLFASSKQAITIDNNNRIDTINMQLPRTTTITKSLIKGNKLFYTSWRKLSIYDFENHTSDSIEYNTELLSIVNSDNDSLIYLGAAVNVFEFNIYQNTSAIKLAKQPEVSSIYKDSDRSYWVSSLNNGVSYFGNRYVQVLSNKNILPFEYISNVRKFGNLLVLTSDKFSLCTYNIATGKIESIYNDSENIPGRGFSNTIRLTPKGDILVSFRVVLLKIDRDGRIFVLPLKQANYDVVYTDDAMVSLHAEHIVKRPLNGSIVQNVLELERMSIMTRHLFYDDNTDDIYAFGSSGLLRINANRFDSIINYNHIKKIENNVSSFAKYNDSIFIVGTTDNGIHFMKHDSIFASLTKNDLLISNYIHCIFVDSNEIWLGTDKGMDRLIVHSNNKQVSIQHIGKRDGIYSNEITDIFIDNDTVFASSPSGLFFFDKKHINQIKERSILNIDYVKINGEETKLEDLSNLQPVQNKVKLKFTGISYHLSGEVLYRYKLAPHDKEWHYTTSREIEYASLSPNNYQFTIQCKGSGGWSAVKTIPFSIRPTFFQRLGVQILGLLLILLIVILIVVFRIKVIKRGHKIKERLLRLENENLESLKNQAIKGKELIELEQQALRLHMNPHFIFNAINAIQGFYAGKEINKAKQFISYFSKLLRMILETSKEKLVPVTTEVEIVRNYLELFLLRFENKYEYNIFISEDIDAENVQIPPMIVQPFVENAVLHGISPLKSKGKISIKFEKEDGILKITIQDDGIGRKKSGELKMFNTTKSTGIKVTQMRLKHINEQLNIGKYVEIIDLENQGEDSGTLVILRVHIINKY
jgi:sensor histidine kinase YesM/ligand-binding sensor domain-containing protein